MTVLKPTFTKEELEVMRLATQWGWENIYCYFNNKKPYNCLAKSIRFPANSDTNGMIWICDDCKQKLLNKLYNGVKEQ